jgi:hypothetical protein
MMFVKQYWRTLTATAQAQLRKHPTGTPRFLSGPWITAPPPP